MFLGALKIMKIRHEALFFQLPVNLPYLGMGSIHFADHLSGKRISLNVQYSQHQHSGVNLRR